MRAAVTTLTKKMWRSWIKATLFPANRAVCGLAELTYRQSDRQDSKGHPPALPVTPLNQPIQLSCSLLALHVSPWDFPPPLSLIEECPGWNDNLWFTAAPKQRFKWTTFIFKVVEKKTWLLYFPQNHLHQADKSSIYSASQNCSWVLELFTFCHITDAKLF